MKRTLLFVSLTMVLGLFGCTHTIDRVEQRWGPPASVEQQGDYTLYSYSFNKASRRGPGVLNVTLTCDNAGNILSKSQTWEPSESVAPLPSPYMKKRMTTVQPRPEEVEASAGPPQTDPDVNATTKTLQPSESVVPSPYMKKKVGTVQSLREEAEVSADPPQTDPDVNAATKTLEPSKSAVPLPSPYMKKEVGAVQPLREEAEVSADPPQTDPDVTLGVGVEGPPEGNGVYYDGPFDIDGISLYYYGGGFYYAAPGDPHRLLFHHRCPPNRLEFYRNHWRNGWRGFHDRWVQSHKQPWRNDPKREIHRNAPVNKASTPPSRTYTSSKASTPPKNTYTPPPKTYTPPQKANTPPPAYTPPPRTYTPPPKHWNPMTKRWE
jgi:hypothetical protein